MEGVRIRLLRATDAEATERIIAESPEATRWNPEKCEGLPVWVAERATGVAGFVIACVAADEMEILDLAVEPASRRRGVGSALVDAALEHGRKAGAASVFLEVRESNERARRFYQKHGFAVSGRRPRYYREPGEDALVMSRSLGRA